ncbi:hypothetical protein [Psychroflexus maritimus]|uniref:Uncharacterized protein n=1 Tax=Psychroflexus maritimus TaxID=2714865 RepID=A0A967DZD8_9FLAO|nr:hypothetical protein [Psychroflexus maritimus]NGZ90830.1 hypothetical protein [Psychroflexus maritimus]
MKLKHFFFSLLLIFSHCQRNNQEAKPPVIVNDLKINHSFETEDYSLKFIQVITDSRCPKETSCVWPGSIEVEVEIENYLTKKKELKIIQLDAPNSQDEEIIKIGKNRSIFLKNLKPYPQQSTREIKNEDYQLIFYEVYTKA